MGKAKKRQVTAAPAFGDEPLWGDPEHSQPRENFHPGEVAGGLMWLSVAALCALVVEVVFLGVWITVAGVAIPLPWTIPVAYVANLIITNTALLWTHDRRKAAVPVVAWVVGFGALLLWASVPGLGDTAMGPWLRTIALLTAGVFGGLWPLRHVRAL